MIYIDPPYNTGEDFIYEDDFSMDRDEYLEKNNTYDDEGNRLVKNTETNGRFHTDWLNMMYPRLMLARNLLSEDGVIFISIDDNEVANLRKICDEIFGEHNFICSFIWKSKLGKVGTTNIISTLHEYILCYSKNISLVHFNMIENENTGRKENLRQWGIADRREDRPSMFYPIKINGKNIYPIKDDGTEGRWRVGKAMSDELLQKGLLEVVEKNGSLNIYRKFLPSKSYSPYDNLLLDSIGTTANGSKLLNQLGLSSIFNFSKPIELIRYFITLFNDKNDIILDFFSGSATTAHAVMQLNAEDGGNRKFIMVQIPEKTDEKSEAFKAGYPNICEIGKERIRRAGKKIKETAGLNAEHLDIGFRVFKVASSNMNDVYYTPDKIDPQALDNLLDNIKSDRTPEDLLFQVMLDLGIYLSSEIKVDIIAGKKVFNVEKNYLIACFDQGVTCDVVEAIAKKHPQYAVFRDSSFADDNVATNIKQIFKLYAPDTTFKTL